MRSQTKSHFEVLNKLLFAAGNILIAFQGLIKDCPFKHVGQILCNMNVSYRNCKNVNKCACLTEVFCDSF